jgi:SM-20-related protein
MNPNEIVLGLKNDGFCVSPAFLEASELADARADFEMLWNQGQFGPAQVHRPGLGEAPRARSDETCWWEDSGLSPIQESLMQKICALGLEINRQLYLGLSSFSGHYASYLKGGRYERHLDRRESQALGEERAVSFVLYLNTLPEWVGEDGGQLQIFPQLGIHSGKSVVIQPQGGTLVCFLSDEIEHEVLESDRVRSSFAGWYHRGAAGSNPDPLSRHERFAFS